VSGALPSPVVEQGVEQGGELDRLLGVAKPLLRWRYAILTVAAYAFSFQHLIYPMLDDRTCTTADPHPVAGEFLWTTHNNHFGWSALLGAAPGGEGVSCYAAAARADDVSRLPPTFISTGALDLFLEEDLEYARRLMRAGVPVELHVYPGAFHAFDMDPAAAVSAQARRDSHDALRRALARRAG